MAKSPKDYRPCVGIAVFNENGQVWMGKRYGQKGPHSWQMPQGGIDDGEAPEHAAIRELFEETGMRLKHLTPLGEIDHWVYYDFPPWHRQNKGKKWRGQKQRWFAFRFNGKNKHIDLQSHGPQEFSKWKWVDLSETPELIVPFKRDVYEEITAAFERFATPVKKPKHRHG